MLNSLKFGNLTIVDDDQTNLLQSEKETALLKRMFHMCHAIVYKKLTQGLLSENFVVIQLSPDACLVVYANKNLAYNPMFFRYDTQTQTLSEYLPGKEIKPFLTAWKMEYLKSRIGCMDRISMQQLLPERLNGVMRERAMVCRNGYAEIDHETA